MSFKLRLFDKNILKTLRSNIKVNKAKTSDYSQYINSEFSLMRLTHDDYDNHYFRDASEVTVLGPSNFDVENVRSRMR